MYRIFYADYIPSLNKGELTILHGMLESFRHLGEVELTLLSYDPKLDVPRYGPGVKTLDFKKCWHLRGKLNSPLTKIWASIWVTFQYIFFLSIYKVLGLKAFSFIKAPIWQEYVKADVILFGHGGVFAPVGSSWLPIACYPLLSLFSAKLLGKRIALYGGSTGVHGNLPWFLKIVSRFILNRIDLIMLRQSPSYQNIINLGVRSDRVVLTADPAFLLKPVSPERVKDIMIQEGIAGAPIPIIGITVAHHIAVHALQGNHSQPSSYRQHIEMLALAIDELTAKHNAKVVFIPHCIGLIRQNDSRDDRLIAQEIYQRCKNKDKVKVITGEYSAEELKGLIGQFRLFIGERIHSVVNAMSMYVPSIVISNSADERLGIIRMLGQEDAICYVENLNSDTLVARVDDVWEKSDEIREQLKSQVVAINERAMLNPKLLKKLMDTKK